MPKPTEIEPPHVIARRVFDALCAQFPDKYIALIQPRAVTDDQPVSNPNLMRVRLPTERLPDQALYAVDVFAVAQTG